MAGSNEKVLSISSNYEAFEAMLPLLMREHSGEYALMRNGEVVEFFAAAGQAQRAGLSRFEDGLFSVQRVEQGSIDLGFYSHARYRRIA